MGGAAIDRIVNRVAKEEKWNDDETPHLRIEHTTEPSDEAIAKTVEHGFAFATQPIFFYAEIESYLANLGPERNQEDIPDQKALGSRRQRVLLY